MNDEDEKSRAFVPSAPIGETNEPDKPAEGADPDCYYGGVKYSPGSTRCYNGVLYLCQSNGEWVYHGSC